MDRRTFLNRVVYYNPIIKALPDSIFLRLHYRKSVGKSLNIKEPRTFNEKLQWLKLYNRNPHYSSMVDKYEVKKYVAEKIGQEHVINTLGVWDNFDDIPFDNLPNQFVLKCTHDSGGIVICTDKGKFDYEYAKKKLSDSMKRNYFWIGREWPYKDVKPRILAEEYLTDKNQKGESLNVYKIMTFNGVPKIIQTIQNDKNPNETIDYFDIDWNLLDLRQDYPNSKRPLSKPTHLSEMLYYSEMLVGNVPFLRTDFYEVNDQVFFSEFTFFSDNGFAKFSDFCWDIRLGEWIDLSKVGSSLSKNKI